MIKGSSGAKINYHSDYVVKSFPGNGRLYQQALWLERLGGSDILPQVYQVRRDYYTMEMLSEPPYGLLKHFAVLQHMIAGLASDVWSKPPEVSFDKKALYDKIKYLAYDNSLDACLPEIHDIGESIEWNALTACMTHGDVTFDNVMIRPSTGQLVLIDPIPAVTSLGAADLRSSDFGHILRSCFGFEAVRYDDELLRFNVQPNDIKMFVGNDNEWRASLFWCVVHMLRTLPYMPAERHAVMRSLTIDALDFASEALR